MGGSGMFSGDVNYSGEDTGYPGAPQFLSNLNPDGSLKSDYTLNAQPALQFQGYMDDENSRLNGLPTLNNQPLKNLEDFAGGHGDSPWAQAQLSALQQSQGQAMGAAKANTQSSNTAAQDAMASRGGLNTGAMQNLARNSSNQGMLAGNNVVGQGLAQQGQIRSQDEQNRLGVASNLPGQEVQAMQPALQEQSLWQQAASQNQAQQQQLAEQQQGYKTGVDQYNMGSKLGGLNAQNTFNMNAYQQSVAQQAGAEQADAEKNRGKK